MRPNAPHNPTVEAVEELSDLGSLVVMAPSRSTGFSSSIDSLVLSGGWPVDRIAAFHPNVGWVLKRLCSNFG